MRDRQRDLEIEHNAAIRRLQEKGFFFLKIPLLQCCAVSYAWQYDKRVTENALKNLERMNQDLIKKLEEQRARYEALNNELDKVSNELATANQNLAAKDQAIKEIKQQRDEYW